jgi:hypothetical protein
MKSPRFIVGLLDTAANDGDHATRARLRDLSLSWARFGYQGPVIDGRGAAQILDAVLERGCEYCLLLAAGTIFDENWYPAHWGRRDVHKVLRDWMADGDFLAAGRPLEAAPRSFQIDGRCLLVNLRRYVACGRPALPGARVVPFESGGSNDAADDYARSWLLCDAPSVQCATLRSFDPAAAAAIVELVSPEGDAAGVAPYLGGRIQEFPDGDSSADRLLTAAQRRFLGKVRGQIEGAKRGVFPWNLEAYDDVDVPPAELESPLSAVYCVAAGFKPYRILKTHGFDGRTRVVLFDYSARALEFRQRLLREWDGANYPAFLRKAFREMPPDTYFQLWAGLSPDQVTESDLDQVWRAEIARWGGEGEFRTHWNLCRSLPHEFILCDLLDNPGPLVDHVGGAPDAVIWWSNAFFTIFSNWFFTIADRRQRYLNFINGLASSAPGLFLYGADHVNSSVNSIRADEYAAQLGHEGKTSDGLIPARFHRLQIRS